MVGRKSWFHIKAAEIDTDATRDGFTLNGQSLDYESTNKEMCIYR